MEKNSAYDKQPEILVATDCIVFGFDAGMFKLLVFKRKVSPFEGEWSLIGSFVNGDETVPDAARRVLFQFTGLEEIYLDELGAYSDLRRDPGGRCISIAQYALINIIDYDRGQVEKYGAKWFSFDELPPLVLDHYQMVGDALEKVRLMARRRPIGFELLPEKFTIPQLQKLYEAIYRRTLDDRNFRKKIMSFGLLIKLDDKDKSGSKKGAFYYRFDHEKYKRLEESGFDFLI